MKYFPSHDRIQSIVEKTLCTWQDAYAYVSENPTEGDYVFNIINHYKEGNGGSMQDLFFKFFTKPIATRCFCEQEAVDNVPKFSGTYVQSFKAEDIVVCPRCGTGRLPLVPEDYEDYYKSGYFAEKYRERLTDFDHEINVAKARYEKLLEVIPKEKITKVLDVGCAIGAFINVLAEDGIEAVGMELYNSEKLYRKSLSEKIFSIEKLERLFTTQYFDVITIYDVLEHVLDLKKFLNRILPFLKHKGYVVVEVPDMGKEEFTLTDENRHHVKVEDFEHIWYFPEQGIRALLSQYNLVVRKVDHPIVGKMTVSAESSSEVQSQAFPWNTWKGIVESTTVTVFAQGTGNKSAKVGVETGIGDAYWILVKLRDFKKKNNIEHLHIYIRDSGEYNRNAPMIGSLDFVDEVSYAVIDTGDVRNGISRNATFIENGQLTKLDYFFVLSEIMTQGQKLDTWMPEWETEWDIQFKVDKPKGFRRKTPMVVLFTSGEGVGQVWMNGFMRERWAQLVDELNKINIKPILMGAKWDEQYDTEWTSMIKDKKGFTSMVGKTTLPEALYLLREADVMIGVVSGMTIMANHFRTPTIALYPGHEYSEGFMWAWTPPGYKEYVPMKAHGELVDTIVKQTKKLLQKVKKK